MQRSLHTHMHDRCMPVGALLVIHARCTILAIIFYVVIDQDTGSRLLAFVCNHTVSHVQNDLLFS